MFIRFFKVYSIAPFGKSAKSNILKSIINKKHIINKYHHI